MGDLIRIRDHQRNVDPAFVAEVQGINDSLVRKGMAYTWVDADGVTRYARTELGEEVNRAIRAMARERGARVSTYEPCGEAFPTAIAALKLRCSLRIDHRPNHCAEIDRVDGEVYLQWPRGWAPPK